MRSQYLNSDNHQYFKVFQGNTIAYLCRPVGFHKCVYELTHQAAPDSSPAVRLYDMKACQLELRSTNCSYLKSCLLVEMREGSRQRQHCRYDSFVEARFDIRRIVEDIYLQPKVASETQREYRTGTIIPID